MVLTGVYALFGRSMRSYFATKTDIALQEYGQKLLNQITGDLAGCKGIQKAERSTICFYNSKGENITYECKENQVFRNDAPLSSQVRPDPSAPEGFSISGASVTFTYEGRTLSLDQDQDGKVSEAELDIDGDGELSGTELGNISLVKIDFWATSKNQRFSAQTSVNLQHY